MAGVPDSYSYRETSHVHLIVGSDGKMNLDKIVGEMKNYTSTQFKTLIKENPEESRKGWLVWMFEGAGKKNSNNNDWSRKFYKALQKLVYKAATCTLTKAP